MSSRTMTTLTGDQKQPDCLPFREMVSPPQSQIAKDFAEQLIRHMLEPVLQTPKTVAGAGCELT